MASDLHTLEDDLPTTAEDIAALRRARRASRLTPVGIARALERLRGLPPRSPRRPPSGREEPFEL